MKRVFRFSCAAILSLLALSLIACSNNSPGNPFSAPVNTKIKMWITLSNNPDDVQLTTLTSAQTAQGKLWAMSMSEESVVFKVNLYQGDKLTGLASNIRTEGNNKAVSAGGLSLMSTPLEPGNYTLKAHSGGFGEVVGVLDIVVTNTVLSEQPDMPTFQKYFTEMGLGRLPPGGKMPNDFQKNVSVFLQGESLMLYGSVIQEVQISARYYNVDAKQEANSGGQKGTLKTGGFASGETLSLPPGKYEYKVYVGDMLVGVFPFEVR